MSCETISVLEADLILIKAGRMEMNMTDQEKLDAVNEITGKNYTKIDHGDKATA